MEDQLATTHRRFVAIANDLQYVAMALHVSRPPTVLSDAAAVAFARGADDRNPWTAEFLNNDVLGWKWHLAVLNCY
jgi:hypothetical protein